MFNNISWSAYWTFIACSCLAYYAYVGWTYFIVMSRQQVTSVSEPVDPLYPIAESCSAEISAYLLQFAGAKNKDELVYGISHIIKKYPGLKDTSYQPAINRVIKKLSSDKCFVHLVDDELRQMWVF